jgi:hypothetical protein
MVVLAGGGIMSYCRFSSNNMMCDVYVYADCGGGWTTHVAGRRLVCPPIPEPPFNMVVVRDAEFDKVTRKLVYKRKRDKFIASITGRLYNLLSKPHGWTLKIIPRKYIGLPHDGETFNHDTPQECAENLEYLRNLGYNVPQYAIDNLKAETECEV